MPKSRREFLTNTSIGLLGVAVLGADQAQSQTQSQTPPQKPPDLPPGAPPAFGTAPAVGPEVSPLTFSEAEKLVQVEMSDAERVQAASSWRSNLAPLYERRTGPHKVELESSLAPYSRWNPILPGQKSGPGHDRFVRTSNDPGPLPTNEADIAFAPLTQLSQWVETRKITSTRLTQIYLSRLEKFNPTLRCVITLTRELALAQAKRADAEIAAGKYRGSLHGIPWGAKDLLDTAGIPTTYGAEPFRDRVPTADAAVVKRLTAAGAVLVAKLSLGALALNDIWFGGQTMNPWLLEEGSSGSSAGPGAATAAALVGFRDRQRDRRQHRQPEHALRNHGIAAHLRPRAAHRRDDALLVARQARPHDAWRRGHSACSARHLRARRRRPFQRAEQPRLRFRRANTGFARGLLPQVDERASRDRRGSRRA